MWYFITGLVISIIIWLIKFHNEDNKKLQLAIKNTENTRTFTLLLLNLVIVAIGVSITMSYNAFSSGGGNISPDQISALYTDAELMKDIVYVILGLCAGILFIYFIDILIAYKKVNKENPNTFQEQIDSLTITINNNHQELLKEIKNIRHKEIQKAKVKTKVITNKEIV